MHTRAALRNRFATLACILAACAAFAQDGPAGSAPPEAPPEVAKTPAATEKPARPKFGPASVSKLTDLRQVPDDIWAAATFGDIVMRNDRATFVFGALPEDEKERNPARDGILLDAFPNARAQEHFSRTYLVLGDANTQEVRTTRMEMREDKEKGTATLVVEQACDRYPSLVIETEYYMEPEYSGLRATTTIHNIGPGSVDLAAVGDMVYWGVMGPFIPSVGWSAAGAVDADAEFIYARYYDSYLFMMPEAAGLYKARHSRYETRLIHHEKVTLAEGEEDIFGRWILCASDNPGHLVGEVLERRAGSPYGFLTGKLNERARTATGDVIDRDVVPNTDVLLRVAKRPDLPQEYIGRPYLMTKTDANGRWAVALPPGDYAVRALPMSRLYQPSGLGQVVEQSKTTVMEEGASLPATLTYEIVDAETKQPIPAKLSFAPLRGSTPPMLGRLGDLVSESSVYTATGRGVVEVPRGGYRIVASHGTEYDVTEERVNFEDAKPVSLRFELHRAFKPEGWVSADLAVRTSASPDVRTSAEDRVVTAAAEGVQWIVTADQGVLTDLAPAVQKLGYGERIKTSVGFRTEADKEPVTGDILVAPVSLCGEKSLGDFMAAVKPGDPRATLSALKELCPGALTLLLRPTDARVGLLKAAGGEEKLAYVPKEDPPSDFDGIEVWHGKKQEETDLAYAAYMELLSRGVNCTPFGASDAGGTWGSEPGYPRLYIKSSKTRTTELDEAELIANFRRGLVQVTNGPLIEYTVEGKSPGQIATARAPKEGEVKRVNVDLRIYAPNWSTISKITVNKDGRFAKQIFIPGSGVRGDQGGMMFPRADNPEEGRFAILTQTDCVIDILVESDPGIVQDPINPRIVPTPQLFPQGQRTMARSAPIFVDADGDGRITLPPYMENRAPQMLEDPEDVMPPF